MEKENSGFPNNVIPSKVAPRNYQRVDMITKILSRYVFSLIYKAIKVKRRDIFD